MLTGWVSDTGHPARDGEVMLKHNLRENEADGGMLLRYAGGGDWLI